MQMSKKITSSYFKKIFMFDERKKNIQSIYNAEEKKEIPVAERMARGKVHVRHWNMRDIPKIGEKFGFLNKPKKQQVLCKYIQKGGVLKTSTSFNEARTLALNGIKTLIIGQDFECSITDVVLPRKDQQKLEDNNNRPGLYHHLVHDEPLDKIIVKTDLNTLDIIPETHDLVVLEKWLNRQTRREYVYKDKLLPLLEDYEVIIFDNGPSWNHLIENAIACSDAVICPLGCNLLAYNSSETNLSTIFEFQDAMGIDEQKLIMFSTMLDRTSLSVQINGQYLSRYADNIIPIPIRRSIKGEEALLHRESIIEYAPTSSLAIDYYKLIVEIWKRVNFDIKTTNNLNTNQLELSSEGIS